MFTWTLPGQTWTQTRVESRTQSHFWQNMVKKKKSSWNNKKHKLIYLHMQSAICSVSTSVIFRKSDTVNATEWFRCRWGYWKSYILNPFLSVQHSGETCQHACSPSVLDFSFESTFVIFESLLGLLIGSFSTIHHQRVSLLRLYRLFKFQSSHLWMNVLCRLSQAVLRIQIKISCGVVFLISVFHSKTQTFIVF